ncbi:hypothetical protein P175DRAFT_0195202 [Aspergillus ochraceoroseus IBT 24754]|uniref:Esterase n=3 Tax=Aspergillus subgen. Nidulantes TaxID=2720870 RepID=A0A0F8WQL4_9EURO|nr:uncharacterized protein P175DRAFT_0195202 [Aspergillus ochraceoroseus IBT 24754]KKK19945.1 hypothetical protein ARAM_005467 [Aspergillus rambellii]KKK23643.1 hypothetical protein AOCH_002770 [Aspergillus ochraceoroseus]PTU21682.1 hypothetical protein P175DRAFT_0195202 [Aspergillus ochraceoroseus IBT 24754]
MAPSYPGVLHNYAPRLVAFEFAQPSTPPKPNSLLFIGGLTDGLYTVPYVEEIAKALEPTDWSLFSLVLTSSYDGWGVGSLDRDVEEIAQCVSYVRQLKTQDDAKIVIMGHSTGSQDVLHYLHSANPAPKNPDIDGLQQIVRPPVDGAIMQAPVSDREAMLTGAKGSSEAQDAWEKLVEFAQKEPARTICPIELMEKVGLPSGAPVNARRFWSLASPESPAKPAEDDLFSSDLTDERLNETFGRVASRGLLRSTLVVLYSGNDEYAPENLDKEALTQRWKRATDAGGVKKWDDEASGVIPGASHNVKDDGQDFLIDRVLNYLNRV